MNCLRPKCLPLERGESEEKPRNSPFLKPTPLGPKGNSGINPHIKNPIPKWNEAKKVKPEKKGKTLRKTS